MSDYELVFQWFRIILILLNKSDVLVITLQHSSIFKKVLAENLRHERRLYWFVNFSKFLLKLILIKFIIIKKNFYFHSFLSCLRYFFPWENYHLQGIRCAFSTIMKVWSRITLTINPRIILSILKSFWVTTALLAAHLPCSP